MIMLGFLCTRPSLCQDFVIRLWVKPRRTCVFTAGYFRLYFSDVDRLTRLASLEKNITEPLQIL